MSCSGDELGLRFIMNSETDLLALRNCPSVISCDVDVDVLASEFMCCDGVMFASGNDDET